MGALLGIGVSVLGTAAGRTAATLLLGNTRNQVRESKLERLSREKLIKADTFGSSNTSIQEGANLLSNLFIGENGLPTTTAPKPGVSNTKADQSTPFDRAILNLKTSNTDLNNLIDSGITGSRRDALTKIRDTARDKVGELVASGKTQRVTTKVPAGPSIFEDKTPSEIASIRRASAERGRKLQAEADKKAAALFNSSAEVEKRAIAARQAAFQKKVKTGRLDNIGGLSTKTLLGRNL